MVMLEARTPIRKGFVAVVSEIEDLAPRVRRIRLSGRELIGIDWTPGHKIKLQAGEKLRSYTPARVDADAGWMDIVFFLHGNGPASRWAASVSVGERTRFIGPVKSIAGLKSSPEWAMFLGDETAIGLAAALLESLPESVSVVGAIVVDAIDSPAIQRFGLPLNVALRQQAHGEALLDWLKDRKLPEGPGMVWLSGEAGSVRALKRVIEKRSPSAKVRCKTKSYWSCKGHAHRKALKL